ncbi:hypothetical protein M0R89_21465 (plasmid) [Halorussus limi]|uniref:DUF8130 domain-containing protein n=1 Tax=Halorussus limi TaxID=2938695 RepID=A0A8U0I251_9EURY|nr:hypothetical protein [Halorussus limi]UPV76764.1 hypothetical protein M0R89_21465 [Halorussus limi]
MSPSATRRGLLRTATGLAVSTTVAGCNQQKPSDRTTSRTTTSGTTTESPTLVDIKRESYLAKAWTLSEGTFRFPETDAVPLSDLDKSVRDAVRTAIESSPYETRDATQAFLDSIDGVNLVAYNGTVWDIEHTFPTVTVRLDTDISKSEPVKNRTVASNSEDVQSNDAIQEVVSTIASLGVETQRRPYETTRLEPSVRDFLDRYDYIETPQGVGEIVISRTKRAPPHTVRAQEVTDEELYGRRVWEATEYGPPTRDFIDRVLTSDRKTPGNYQDRIHTTYPDEVPRQFAKDLNHDSNYVRVDDAVYVFETRHVHWDELPLAFHATVSEENAETAGSVDIRLSVQNTADHSVQLQMAGIAPFGVLWAYGLGGEHVLWNDAYEQTENVVIEGQSVTPESHAEMDLLPGRTESATYRLGHDQLGGDESLQTGTYEALGTIWAKWPTYEGAKEYDWWNQLFPYTLTITVP